MSKDMSKYYKNFILCGEVDYHCLICQESFQNLDSVDKHLKWEKHRISLKKHDCKGQSKNESIFKIRNDYYCKVCNILTTDPKGHKNMESHVSAKSNPNSIKKLLPIKREADGSISINETNINILEWHGINNDYCTLCRRAIRDISIHVTLNVHIINMIHSETKVYQDRYYRQTSDENLYCFSCSKLFPNKKLDEHWSTDCGAINKAKDVLDKKDQKLINSDPELANALMTLQKIFFDIDESKNQAQCLECGMTIKAILEIMLKHRTMHVDHDKYYDGNKLSYEFPFTEVVDHGKRRHEIANYGKANFFILNEGGSWCYCTICCVSFSAHMNQATCHTRGVRHNAFLELKGLRESIRHMKPNCNQQKITLFLKHIYKDEVENRYSIKNESRITEFSFMLMAEAGKKIKKIKCFACDELINSDDAVKHYKTKIHIDNLLASHVMLLEEKYEFVRMIRPNVYHCGICNNLIPFWVYVQCHLKSKSHADKLLDMFSGIKVLDMRSLRYKANKNDLSIQLKRLGLA